MNKFILFIALLFAFAFSGCSGGSDSGSGNSGGDNPSSGSHNVSGRMTNDSGNEIELEVYSSRPDPNDPNATIEYVVTSCVINGDGSFNFDIPVPPEPIDYNGIQIGKIEKMATLDGEQDLCCQFGFDNMLLVHADRDGIYENVPVTEGWNILIIKSDGIFPGNGIENTCDWVFIDIF